MCPYEKNCASYPSKCQYCRKYQKEDHFEPRIPEPIIWMKEYTDDSVICFRLM